MLVFRSLVIGLLGACCLLLAARPRPRVELWQVPAPATGPTIVDVSPLVAQSQLVSLVRLAPGEHIASLEAPQRYVDVTVAGPSGERRVLLLVH